MKNKLECFFFPSLFFVCFWIIVVWVPVKDIYGVGNAVSWIPLHVHSQYSILEASTSVRDLVKRASSYNIPALALTDYGNLYACIEFYKACLKEEIKPIIGCCFFVAPKSRFDKFKIIGERTSYQLLLLAKDIQGYRNLCALSSKGFLEGFYYHPRIDKDLIQEYKEGLLCLSGGFLGGAGHFAAEGEESRCLEEISWYREVFGDDYYIELQRHEMSEEDLRKDGLFQETWISKKYNDHIDRQKRANNTLIEISKKLGISCVATNASHYLDRADWESHEIQLNIQSGEPCEIWEKDSLGNNKRRIPNPKRRTYFSHEFYFKSPEQMAFLFQDIPEALEASLEIMEKCNIKIDFETRHYPTYIPPALQNREYSQEEQVAEVAKYLRILCEEGIPLRYTEDKLDKVREKYPLEDPMKVVKRRLDNELESIISKNLCDYLLIVWDFIHWAKTNSISVGPGRGSGAGSIILYLIGVTDVEPLRFNLFFERFINLERMSYPDIDVDICMDRRNDVIDYTMQKYGRNNVAQIITFGSMKAKMAIKDIGRVLNVPLSKVNIIAKLIPEDLNMTIEKALEIDADLYRMYQDDEETRRVMDIAKKLEGSIRNTGIHAAGVIVSSKPLLQNIPICKSKDSEIAVTQYSMKPVESVGMLKMDFLGLKTLTCIQKAISALEARTGKRIDYVNLPLDDVSTFQLLNQGRTMGVFQLESSGMQELARQLHLDKFEEIIAVVSLYRPGPMDMIPSYIARKHGRESIEYDHERVKDILDETYGIMVYQEQVMQIAQVLAGYSLGEGDVLRRAMGKKDMEEMLRQREKFLNGAVKNGVEKEVAERIFDKMEKFASYGFNKSHAAAYAFLSYVTAYLKANYPSEWMAALMTCDRDDLTKVAKFIRESQSMGIPILPPYVNESGNEFVGTLEGIRFAMSGIKGVGEGVVEAIVKERNQNGPFKNLYDFIQRIDRKKVGKKNIENLVDAGGFDFTNWSRDALKESIEGMYSTVAKDQKDAEKGIISLFSLMEDEERERFNIPPKLKTESSKHDILMKEKELLGFFLTGHPMDAYRPVLDRLSCIPLLEVEKMDHDALFRSAFILETVQVRVASKSQRKFSILTISDGMERFELPVWPDLYEEKGHLLLENQLLYAVLQVDKKESTTKLVCKWFDDLTKVDESMIAASDRAYERAKSMMEKFGYQTKDRFLSRNNGKIKEKKRSKMQSKSNDKVLCVVVNSDRASLSHMLQVKKIFKRNSGNGAILIDFHSKGDSVATLEIDSSWGIEYTSELKENLLGIPSIEKVGNSV